MTLIAKVCGLCRAEDAAFASSAGADLLGFVSHPPSPRHCADLTVAGAFLDRAVLVQVSEQPEAVLALAQRFGFQRVQPYLPRETRSRGVALLQAAGLVVLLPWADEPDQDPVPADLYVWEPSSTQTGVLGGSGQRHAMTHLPPGDFLLAGGLDAGNLRERVGSLPTGVLTRIRGVDAASRLEALAGAKDPAKVAAFVHLAHDLEFA